MPRHSTSSEFMDAITSFGAIHLNLHITTLLVKMP